MSKEVPGQREPRAGEHSLSLASSELLAVLESASRLQDLVPDAVLVGGSAAALYAGHRDYYADQHDGGRGVAAQLARQLADSRPKDSSVTRQLGTYRNLAARWTDWREVRSVCRKLAADMLRAEV
jgi:hypothetical protein